MENLIQGFLWAVGGWLLVRSLFSLRVHERLLTGGAAGFVLFGLGANLLAPFLGVRGAGWAAAPLLMALGLVAALRGRAGREELFAELSSWPQLVFLAAATLLFTLMLGGASIFDEYAHLPLVSTMAAGDIPPHFYLDPGRYFAYHYGLHVFAAGLTASGASLPWEAWDLSRGLALGFTLLLGWLWVRRWTGSGRKGVLGSLLLVFGGGTRWLMLLLPVPLLAWLAQGLGPITSPSIAGPDLASALSNPWKIDGLGSMPIPFAYHNGLFSPVSFSLGGSGAMAFFTTLLLLLLSRPAPNLRRPAALAVLSVLFASLALSAEHFFAFWWAAAALALPAAWLLARKRKTRLESGLVGGWLVLLAGSALLSLLQGGFVTETARGLLSRLLGSVAEVSNLYSFRLRWPPAVTDIHLGALSVLNLRQLGILLFELGPLLLLIPLALRWGWKALRRGEFWSGSLSLSGLLLLGFALFFEYGLDVQMYRFVKSALWSWLALAAPAAFVLYPRLRPGGKALAGLGYGALIYAGVMLFAILLTTAPTPRPSYYLDGLDAGFTQRYWNRLGADAKVLDSTPYRAVTIFGRSVRAYQDFYEPYPDWQALVKEPLPEKAAAAGFAYVYMSDTWWNDLSPNIQAAYQQPCVRLVEQLEGEKSRWRRLLDIGACRR